MNQNKATPTVIGIDIGAHSSKIAAVQRGAIEIITNEANFRQTPSIVGYGQAERKIGESGNVKLKSNFKNTIVSPMRYLSLADATQQLIFNPSSTKSDNGLLFKVKNHSNKETLLAPEQVLASYLTHINHIILENNLDAKLITIAVPSYFTELEKQAVLNSAQISQMTANGKVVKLVDQNVAIGLDYGVFKKNEISETKEAGKTVCFVDFGHSKLSMALIKFSGQQMEVLLQKNVRNLGCRDIDQKLLEHYAQIFKQKTGLDLHENKKAVLKLLETVQRQRKMLTGLHESDISIECLMEDEDISQPISRQIMFEIAQQVFASIRSAIQQFKIEAQKLDIEFSEVQLVGGGTRIPKVIEIIKQEFNMQPSRTINSNQCIANGATLASVEKSGLFRLHTFKVMNKLSNPIRMSIREVGNNEIDEQKKDEYVQVFGLNAQLGSEKTISIEKQGKIQLDIGYGIQDKSIMTNIIKVEFEVPQIDTQPENQSIEAEQPESNSENCPISKTQILFAIDEQGFFTINKILRGDHQIEFQANKYSSLTKNQMEEFKALERSMFLKDIEIVKSYEKNNQLESFVYQQKEILTNKSLIDYLSEENIEQIQKYFEGLEEELQDSENKYSLGDYEAKAKEVQKFANEVKMVADAKQNEIKNYFGELEKLKKYAVDAINHINSKYRNTRKVAEVYEEIKQVHDWAAEAIQKSKQAKVSELPLVSKQSVEKQQSVIKQGISALSNPQPRQPQSQAHPFMGNFGYQQSPRYQGEPRRRMGSQTSYDPFGMSRSSFFPSSNNFFGGLF